MSGYCHTNNFLQRDGTSQQQRLLKALLPEYVAVDERKIKDLEEFAKKLAAEIRYYNESNSHDGDWVEFFTKSVDPGQQTDPHYALFHAFLQLFRIAQDDLNQLTRKHLDFYYRDVLGLKEKAAEPDQVFMILSLAKHVNAHLVTKGTQLKAGKDRIGKELIYKTDKDIVVNKGNVKEIKSIYKNPQSRIYGSPVANSADGAGAKIETAEMSWRTFGKPEGNVSRAQAEVGFAFASPLLFLEGGDRELTITLQLKDTGIAAILAGLDLRYAFRVRFSGEKEWIEPLIDESEWTPGLPIPPAVEQRILSFLNSATSWEAIAGIEPQAGPVFDDPGTGYGDQINDYDIGRTVAERIIAKRNTLGAAGFTSISQVDAVQGMGSDKINDLAYTFRNPSNYTQVDVSKRQIIIRRTITKDQPPIVAYNVETLLDPFVTQWPVVKITLDTNASSNPFAYDPLSKLKLQDATLSVEVSEFNNLIVQNDQSVLDPGKDFQPFGIRPLLGSNFYIGSREVFSKQLEMLKIGMLWHGLPLDLANGFQDYYTLYGGGRNNESFKANVYLLDKKEWTSIETASSAKPLFEHPLTATSEVTITSVGKLKNVDRDVKLPAFDVFDTNSKKGFLRLELSGTDFGHKDYQGVFTKQVLTAVKNQAPDTAMPDEPYTPQAKSIFLNYRSALKIDLATPLTKAEFDKRIEQFFHVGAFGVAEQITKNDTPPDIDLFPQYNDEGELYIGIADFTPGSVLSLLFQVAEGSADPDLEQQPLQWSYLSDNNWIALSKFDVLSDSTNGLLTSGIINFDVSKNATFGNTLLPAGLVWLKAAVSHDSDAVSDLIAIIAQAVTATFSDNENDPDHLKEALAQGTISKPKIADSAIKKFDQPFASFGGKVRELSAAFYTRVSERLRHKNRAITIWDYERLVLEKFAAAYKVKCLSHTRYTGSLSDYSELAPGHVSVIVISNVRNKNAVDPLRPKTSLITLVQIREYISKLNSSGVELHVKNPIFEEIQVKTNVRFYPGYDSGFYGKKLEDDIKAFLSPWAFDTTDLVFGGRMHKSVILNFIEELPYVDFVTCFEMYHIVKNPGTGAVVSKTQVDEAVATTAVSILGSTGQKSTYGDHLINVLETDACECDDNEIKPTAMIASVDDCPCDDNMFEM